MVFEGFERREVEAVLRRLGWIDVYASHEAALEGGTPMLELEYPVLLEVVRYHIRLFEYGGKIVGNVHFNNVDVKRLRRLGLHAFGHEKGVMFLKPLFFQKEAADLTAKFDATRLRYPARRAPADASPHLFQPSLQVFPYRYSLTGIIRPVKKDLKGSTCRSLAFQTQLVLCQQTQATIFASSSGGSLSALMYAVGWGRMWFSTM